MPALTIGQGANRPQGFGVDLKPPYPEAVFAAIKSQPGDEERWQSIHTWEGNYRKTENWRSSIGVCLDLDYKIPKAFPPGDLRARLVGAAAAGDLPFTDVERAEDGHVGGRT